MVAKKMARLAKTSHLHRIYTFQANLPPLCISKDKWQIRSTGLTSTNNSHWQKPKCSKWATSLQVVSFSANSLTTPQLRTTRISSFCKGKCLRLQCKIILCHSTTPRGSRHQYFLVTKKIHWHTRRRKTLAACNPCQRNNSPLSNTREWIWHLKPIL